MNVKAKVKEVLSTPSKLEELRGELKEARNRRDNLRREQRDLSRAVKEDRARNRLGEERRHLAELDEVDAALEDAEAAVQDAEEEFRAHVREVAGPDAMESLLEAEGIYRRDLEKLGRAVAEAFADALTSRAAYRSARDAVREMENLDPDLRRKRKQVGQDAEPAEILGLAALRALRPLVVADEPLGPLWAEAGVDVADGSFVRASPLNQAETLRIKQQNELPI